MLSNVQKGQIVAQVKHFVDLGNSKLNTDLVLPNVIFKKRGTCGGTARYAGRFGSELNFNQGLAVDNFDEYMNDVVPHEVAHLLKEHVYGTRRGRLYSAHGAHWRNVMRTLGVNPQRCHTMDVSKVTTRRPQNKFIYICSNCNEELLVGPKHHKKIEAGMGKMSHKGCKGAELRYNRPAGAVSWDNAAEQKAPKAPKAPKAGTKISKAFSVYARYVGATRQDMITYIKSELESLHNVIISRSQATSYYQQCKKLAQD